ncbi:MAG: outer membrane beta-barrel protein [Acidobacteriota bacterium]
MRRPIIAAVVMLLASWSMAQGRPGSIELTPFAGYWLGDTFSRGTISGLDFDVKVDDAPAYGLRLAYRFTEHWAIDWMLAHERADLVTGDGGAFGGQSKIGNMEMTTGEIGVEGAFGRGRMVPFIGGGIGLSRLSPDIAGMSSDTRFAANFGAGFKLFFSPTVALRFDWRGHSVNVGNDHSHCDWWDNCGDYYRNNWITFQELSLGLTFVF